MYNYLKKTNFFLDLEDQFYCTQVETNLGFHKSEKILFTLLMAQHAYECFLKNNPLDLTEKQEEILLLASDDKEQYELLRLLCAGKIKEKEAKSIFMRYRDPLSDSDIQKLRSFMDKVQECRENPILNFPEKPKEITIKEITEYIERKTKKD